ncbi:MAG: family 20 glycosylhydrolase [Thermoplasmata archaeon]
MKNRKFEYNIFPKPRKIEIKRQILKKNSLLMGNSLLIDVISQNKNIDFKSILNLKVLKDLCFAMNAKNIKFSEKNKPCISIILDEKFNMSNQWYVLTINDKKVEIKSKTLVGLNYALLTLKNIIKQSDKYIHSLVIEDYPDFEDRVIMLDISRNKIPKLKTLFNLVDKFSEVKINQLQLYMENAFAYKGHEIVWKDLDPLTPEEVKKLDDFCKERFIELVPNQNCFGHLHEWLKHKKYKHLAEDPNNPSVLCPTDPNSINFIDDILGQLLINFNSVKVNIGCDEVNLKGRSFNAIKVIGEGKVYLDFILKIREIVKKYNKREILFWGDIILKYPELIDILPKDMIILIWGYTSSFPYYQYCSFLSNKNVNFYVCPGTSSWNSIGGIWENCRVNLLNAAINGSRYGAKGFLITDWGDNGHWQVLTVSYPGFFYGAGVAWCWKENYDVEIEKILDIYAFDNKSSYLGKTLVELGRVSFATGVYTANGSPLFYLFHEELDEGKENKWNPSMPFWIGKQGLKKAKKQLNIVDKYLKKIKLNSIEVLEIRHTLRMLKHSFLRTNLIIEKFKKGEFDKKIILTLIQDYKVIIKEFRKLWIKRFKKSGVKRSLKLMKNLLLDKYKEALKNINS